MKLVIAIAIVFIGNRVFAQSREQTEILNLSNQIFNWEVENKTDSLANLFDESFTVVNSRGEAQNKQQYLALLHSGNILHNSIHVETNKATVINSTATVIGKGTFYMTVSSNKVSRHLSYIQVFSRYNNG